MPVRVAAVDMTLPNVFARDDLLLSCVNGLDDTGRTECAASAFADNNAIPLGQFNDDNYAPRNLDVSSVYARWGLSQWVRVYRGDWIFSAGQGQYSEYNGNRDAGQLWIDLHSIDATGRTYEPEANGYRVQASWYALGRAFSYERGGSSGTCEVYARYITTSDMLARSVVGNVDGDNYTGMIRTLRASAAKDGVSGRGWALDCRVTGNLKNKMRFLMSVEGLLGQVSWRQAVVEDDYVSSPNVFEDPDGFLHDYFAMSGAGWKEDKSMGVGRVINLGVVQTHTTPYKIMGLTWQKGYTTLPKFGAAWPQQRNWIPYCCYYPSESRLEIGSYAQTWHIGASADFLSGGSPKAAAIDIGINLSF